MSSSPNRARIRLVMAAGVAAAGAILAIREIRSPSPEPFTLLALAATVAVGILAAAFLGRRS